MSSLYSDHCPVILEIDFTRFKRGRGFWKLNNSLLRDSSYVSTIKNIIKYTTCQYAQIDGKEAFFELNNDEYNAFLDEQTPESLQSLELSLNPELFFDVLQMEIRRISIQYASTKKRNQNYEEQKLLKDIDLLERRLQNNNGVNDHIADELELKKISLEDIYKHKAQGAYIRSRARYKTEG